ncbi:MAG: putative toxin-antitoxin system toxin component, PIN family [Syntrophobacteraceae bacterium]|jgi:putative PIN family toxin of toxin-antitoxin system
MLKVVIDTNVLVSALLKPDSVPELILSLILEGEMVLCLSEPIATEYEEVLAREKFKKLDRQKVKALLSRFKSQAQMVTPKIHLQVALADPEDNKFLECAEEAEADFFITGNIKHFPPGKFKGTIILRPAEFLFVIAKTLDS